MRQFIQTTVNYVHTGQGFVLYSSSQQMFASAGTDCRWPLVCRTPKRYDMYVQGIYPHAMLAVVKTFAKFWPHKASRILLTLVSAWFDPPRWKIERGQQRTDGRGQALSPSSSPFMFVRDPSSLPPSLPPAGQYCSTSAAKSLPYSSPVCVCVYIISRSQRQRSAELERELAGP